MNSIEKNNWSVLIILEKSMNKLIKVAGKSNASFLIMSISILAYFLAQLFLKSN